LPETGSTDDECQNGIGFQTRSLTAERFLIAKDPAGSLAWQTLPLRPESRINPERSTRKASATPVYNRPDVPRFFQEIFA